MKQIQITIIFLCVISVITCSGGKYSDLKEIINNTITATNSFIEQFDKADSKNDTKAILHSLTVYIDKTRGLQKEMDTVIEKYPELKKSPEPPAELQKEMDRLAESMKKVHKTFLKLKKYAQDPNVAKALKEIKQQ